MTEEEPRLYEVVCHTPGCGNEGYALHVPGYGAEPAIVCGPCGVAITDITPVTA
jgi:hypothetical protein